MTQKKSQVPDEGSVVLNTVINNIKGNDTLKQVLFADLKDFRKYNNVDVDFVYLGSQIITLEKLESAGTQEEINTLIDSFVLKREEIYAQFQEETSENIQSIIVMVKADIISKQVKANVEEIIQKPIAQEPSIQFEKVTMIVPGAVVPIVKQVETTAYVSPLTSYSESYINEHQYTKEQLALSGAIAVTLVFTILANYKGFFNKKKKKPVRFSEGENKSIELPDIPVGKDSNISSYDKKASEEQGARDFTTEEGENSIENEALLVEAQETTDDSLAVWLSQEEEEETSIYNVQKKFSKETVGLRKKQNKNPQKPQQVHTHNIGNNEKEDEIKLTYQFEEGVPVKIFKQKEISSGIWIRDDDAIAIEGYYYGETKTYYHLKENKYDKNYFNVSTIGNNIMRDTSKKVKSRRESASEHLYKRNDPVVVKFIGPSSTEGPVTISVYGVFGDENKDRVKLLGLLEKDGGYKNWCEDSKKAGGPVPIFIPVPSSNKIEVLPYEIG